MTQNEKLRLWRMSVSDIIQIGWRYRNRHTSELGRVVETKPQHVILYYVRGGYHGRWSLGSLARYWERVDA